MHSKHSAIWYVLSKCKFCDCFQNNIHCPYVHVTSSGLNTIIRNIWHLWAPLQCEVLSRFCCLLLYSITRYYRTVYLVNVVYVSVPCVHVCVRVCMSSHESWLCEIFGFDSVFTARTKFVFLLQNGGMKWRRRSKRNRRRRRSLLSTFSLSAYLLYILFVLVCVLLGPLVQNYHYYCHRWCCCCCRHRRPPP